MELISEAMHAAIDLGRLPPPPPPLAAGAAPAAASTSTPADGGYAPLPPYTPSNHEVNANLMIYYRGVAGHHHADSPPPPAPPPLAAGLGADASTGSAYAAGSVGFDFESLIFFSQSSCFRMFSEGLQSPT